MKVLLPLFEIVLRDSPTKITDSECEKSDYETLQINENYSGSVYDKLINLIIG